MENSMESLKKLKINILYDPAISFLGIYPKGKNTHLKRYIHPYVQCSTIYNSEAMGET